jgi:hypothetical protein
MSHAWLTSSEAEILLKALRSHAARQLARSGLKDSIPLARGLEQNPHAGSATLRIFELSLGVDQTIPEILRDFWRTMLSIERIALQNRELPGENVLRLPAGDSSLSQNDVWTAYSAVEMERAMGCITAYRAAQIAENLVARMTAQARPSA